MHSCPDVLQARLPEGGKEGIGRGERIRTSDSCVPNAVLYQTELHPDEANAARSPRARPRRYDATLMNQRSRSIAKKIKFSKESLNTDGGNSRAADAARADSSAARQRT